MYLCWGQADAGAGVDRKGMLRTTTRNKLSGVGVKPRFLHGSVDEVSFLGARTLEGPGAGYTTMRFRL